MKTIKYVVAVFAMMFACNANAQKISASNVTIAPEGEAELVISLETTEIAVNTQMTIALPKGIEIPYDADEEEWGVANGSILYAKPSIDINKDTSKEDVDEYTFLIYKNADGAKYKDLSGTLLTITLKASADIAEGEYVGTIKDVVINNEATEEMTGFENGASFTVSVITTGINGISIDDPNAEVYNLNGQRVNGQTAKKGVYVVNGKKVSVK